MVVPLSVRHACGSMAMMAPSTRAGTSKLKYETAQQIIIHPRTDAASKGEVINVKDVEDALDFIPAYKDPGVLDDINFAAAFDDALPAARARQEFMNALDSHDVIIVNGPTGTGKSTQFPLYILAHAKEHKLPCHILVTQPQRIATRAIAQRVANAHLKCSVGAEVGYQIGFERKISARTRLTYCTYGILSRILVAHRSLSSFTHIVLDEIHNRDSETDICTALALILKLHQLKQQQQLSYGQPAERTKIIIMSATLRQSDLQQYFVLPRDLMNLNGELHEKEVDADDDIKMEEDGVASPPVDLSSGKQKRRDDTVISRDIAHDASSNLILPYVIILGKSEHLIKVQYLEDCFPGRRSSGASSVASGGLSSYRSAIDFGHLLIETRTRVQPHDYTDGIPTADSFQDWSAGSSSGGPGSNRRPDTSASDLSAASVDDLITEYYDSPWAEDEESLDFRYRYKPELTQAMCQCIASLVLTIDAKKLHDAGENVTSLSKNSESILIFLPGMEEITRVRDAIEKRSTGRKLRVYMLHSMLESFKTLAMINRDVDDPETRRVILSTNIAESSVTIPHAKFVIDTCLTKAMSHDARGAFSLQLKWASQAQCEQRKGRVGRVQAGECWRMVPEEFYNKLPYQLPSVLNNLPLEKIVLQLKQLESPTPIAEIFETFLDPPEKWRIQRAVSECKDLGALEPTYAPEADALTAQMEVLNLISSTGSITGPMSRVADEGHVTPLGRLMSALPCEPRTSLIVVHAHAMGILYEGIMLAAAAMEPTVFRHVFQSRPDAAAGGNVSAAKLHEWEVEARAADRELIQWTADTGSDLIRVFTVLNHWRLMNDCVLGQPLKETLVFKFFDQSAASTRKTGNKQASAEEMAACKREIMSKKCIAYCDNASLDRRRFEALVNSHDTLLERITRAGFADSRHGGVSVHGSSYHAEWNMTLKNVESKNRSKSACLHSEHLVKQSNIEAECAELTTLLQLCIAGAYFPHVLVGRSAFSRFIRDKKSGVARLQQPFNWSGTHYNSMNVAQVHMHGDIDEQQNASTIAMERPLMQCIDHIIAPQKINALQFAHECTTSEKLSRGSYSTVFIDLPSARCTMPMKQIIGRKSDGSWSSHGSCSIVDAQTTLLSVSIRMILMRLHSTAKPRVNRDMLRIGNTVQRAVRDYSAYCAEHGFDSGSRLLLRVTELIRGEITANGGGPLRSHAVDLDALVTRKRNCVDTNSKFVVGEQAQVRVTCMRDALNMYVLTHADIAEARRRHNVIAAKWSSLFNTQTFDETNQQQHKLSLHIGTTGMWCVALNPESMHYQRARVLSNVRAVSSGRSTCNTGCSGRHWVLYFVDYGNTAVVCREQVRFVSLADEAAYNWLTNEMKLLAHLLTLSNVRLATTSWAPQHCHPTIASKKLYAGGSGIGNSAAMVIRQLIQHYSPRKDSVEVVDENTGIVERVLNNKSVSIKPTTYINVVEYEPGHVAGELIIKPDPSPQDPCPQEININEKMLNDGYFECCTRRVCERPPSPPDSIFQPLEEGELDEKEEEDADDREESFMSLVSKSTRMKKEKRKRTWDADKSIGKPTLAVDGVMQISQRNLDWSDDFSHKHLKPDPNKKMERMLQATSAGAVKSRMEEDYEVRKFRVTSPHRVSWHSKHPLFEQHIVVPTRDSVASMHLDPPLLNGWPHETDEVVAISCHVFLTPPRRRNFPMVQAMLPPPALNGQDPSNGTNSRASSTNTWGRNASGNNGMLTPISRTGSMMQLQKPSTEDDSVAATNFRAALVRLPMLKASSVTIMPRRTGTLSLLTLLYSPNIYLIATRSDTANITFAGATAAFHSFTYNSAFGKHDARTIDCAFGDHNAVEEALEAERLANEAGAQITSDVELAKREEAMRALRSLMRVAFDSDFTYDELDAINEVRKMMNLVFESVGNRLALRSPYMRVLQAAIRRRVLQLFAAKRDYHQPMKFEKWENRAFSDAYVQTWRTEPDKGQRHDDDGVHAEVTAAMGGGGAYGINNPVRRRPHFIEINYPKNDRMWDRVVRSFKTPERMWDRVRLVRALQAFITAIGGVEQDCVMAPFFYGDDAANDPMFPVKCRACREWLRSVGAIKDHLMSVPEPFANTPEHTLSLQDRTALELFREEHMLLAHALRIYCGELTSVTCPYCPIVQKETHKKKLQQRPQQRLQRLDDDMDLEVEDLLMDDAAKQKAKCLSTTVEVYEHLLCVTKSACAQRAYAEMAFMEKKFLACVNQHKKAGRNKGVWEDDEDIMPAN